MPDDYGNPDPEWPRVDWRSHMRRVELPGATVNYVEIGEGESIVFLHGLSGAWQNWLESLPHFGRGRRAIALDLPGFGASPMPAWPIDMPAYGRLVHDFCEKLGVEGGAIVGNSMGGLIAAEAVLSGPGRFGHLVLVGAAGLVNTWRPKERGLVTAFGWNTFGPGVGRVARHIVRHPRARYLTLRLFVRYPNRLRPDLLWEQIDAGLPCPGFSEGLAGVIDYDARHRLAEIEIPTMLLWGMDDLITPPAAALSYHRRIPGSRLEIFERTGHVPQLERPARFNATLEDFLR